MKDISIIHISIECIQQSSKMAECAITNYKITTHSVGIYVHLPVLSIVSFGAISNILLLVAFKKDPLKCFRNSGTYLIMNLSVFDLLTCLLAPFFLKAIEVPHFNNVFEFIVLSSGCSSMLSLVSISVDRFLLVAYPLKHRYFMNRKVILLWFSGIWLMAVGQPSLRLLYGESNTMIGIYCFNTTIILLSVTMYAITYTKLKKHSIDIISQNSTESRAQEKRNNKDKQFLKTIILVACIAFVCLVPSMVYFLFRGPLGILKDSQVSWILLVISATCFYTNFALNPLIYILRLPMYRRTFSLIYCKRRS